MGRWVPFTVAASVFNMLRECPERAGLDAPFSRRAFEGSDIIGGEGAPLSHPNP
jgi:hypothetical protein